MKYWLGFLFLMSFPIAHALDFQQSLRETSVGRQLAKISGHAYCEMKNGAVNNGFNAQQLVALASVSKVFVSYWAVETLGADFRFATKLHIRAVSSTQVDVHLEGSRDPFMGRQMIFFMVSELNRMGVQQIRNLTYDENFRLFLNVQEDIATERGLSGAISAQETGENLRLILNDDSWSQNSRTRYQEAIEIAARSGVTLLPRPSIHTRNVSLVRSADYRAQDRTSTILLQSAPLKNYLKQMNVYSMNYITDTLWENLGGASAFQRFFLDKLNLNSTSLQFYSGSGLPVLIDGQRRDNVATCEATMKVLGAFAQKMNASGLQLSDVMLVGGVDGGTLAGSFQSEKLSGSVVAKTGSIATAKTFAGYVSTSSGPVFFGTFFRVNDEEQAENAVVQRDYIVGKLVAENGGKLALSYSPYPFLPFDQQSYFRDVTLRSSVASLSLH